MTGESWPGERSPLSDLEDTDEPEPEAAPEPQAEHMEGVDDDLEPERGVALEVVGLEGRPFGCGDG